MPGIQNSKKTLAYLGTIGTTDRGDSLQLGNTAQALVELANVLITEARNNLDKGGNVASGQTSQSMRAKDIEIRGTKMELDIEVASTYKFLDQGVKGTESGTGKFSFKTKFPSKKMALSFIKWIKRRRVVTKYKAISKNESKNQSIKKVSSKADSQKSLAYAMATNTKKHGIKPTKFFSKAVVVTKKKQKEILGEGLRLDIIESLKNN